ncbi:tetratricopeptide repeat protein, partial [Pyxidicoccus sp. 3LFB2]
LAAPVPLAEDPALRAKVETVRGELAHAQALLDSGRYQQALPAAKAVADAARALDYRPLEAEALHVLGWAHQRLSQSEESMKAWNAAMTAATAGRHDEAAVQVATDLVVALSDTRDWFSEAHLWAGQAHALLERMGGSPELEGRLANHEGILAFREENYEVAAAHYTRALALRERVLGPTHVDTAKVLNNFGMVRMRQGRFADAMPLYQRSLAITEERLGPQHPLLAATLANLGIVAKEMGRYPEALQWLERSYALRRDTLGPDNRQTLLMLNDLALVHEKSGAPETALALHQQALEGMRRVFGPESVETIDALRSLAMAEERLEMTAAALAHYQEGLALQLRVLPPEDLALHTLEEDVGRLLLLHSKRPREALPLLRVALARKVRTLGKEHPSTVHARTGLGLALLAMNKADRALTELEEAARVLAPLGWSEAESAWVYFGLARALWTVKPAERPRALALAQKAIEGYTQAGQYGRRELEEARRWMASREGARR